MRKNRKPSPKKSRRSGYPPSLEVRSTPVVPDGVRVDCDLTTRTYKADIKTLNEESRSVEAVLATEQRVKVVDWSRLEVIEEVLVMDGLRMPESRQVPLLDTHQRHTVQTQLGSTREMKIENGQLVGRNYYSTSKDSDHAWQLCREGHLTDNSVGYVVHRAEMIDPGKSLEVNGRSYTASPTMALRVSQEWEIRENSVCPIGADAMAKTRQQTRPTNGRNINRKEYSMNFKEWLEARGLVFDDLDDGQRAALETVYKAEEEQARSDKVEVPAETKEATRSDVSAFGAKDAEQIARAAVAAEQKRQAAIRAEANGLGIDEETVNRCIVDPDMTVESARGQFLDVIRKRGTNGVSAGPGIITADRAFTAERMVDAMLLRAGFDDTVLAQNDGAKRAEQADQFRDTSALDICRNSLLLEGRQVTGSREDVIRAALSTATLPTVLGAIYNKSLLRGYNTVEESWRKWCNIGSAPDFKTITRCRLTGAGGFEKVSNGADLPLGSVAEEKEQFNLETYGKKDRFGRQDIINDDLGVLTRVAVRHGRRGKLQIARLVYTHLLANGNMDDGTALFVDGHSNLNTSTALTKANIASSIVTFKQQTDLDGQVVSVIPRFLLVPVELEDTALEHVTSELIVLAGSTDAVRGNKNTLQNKLQVVSDPLLSDSTITGYSATSWYLMSDPSEADTVEVAFLNGRQQPTVHMNPKASDMYIEFEGYIDAGVKALDHRTMQKNNA